jgi:hypothetical protein
MPLMKEESDEKRIHSSAHATPKSRDQIGMSLFPRAARARLAPPVAAALARTEAHAAAIAQIPAYDVHGQRSLQCLCV